jgi:hypothetical protein
VASPRTFSISVPQSVELISEAEPRCGAVTVQFRYLETRMVRKCGKTRKRKVRGMMLVYVLWNDISVKTHLSLEHQQPAHCNVCDKCFCTGSSCWVIYHRQANTTSSFPNSINTVTTSSHQNWTVLLLGKKNLSLEALKQFAEMGSSADKQNLLTKPLFFFPDPKTNRPIIFRDRTKLQPSSIWNEGSKYQNCDHSGRGAVQFANNVTIFLTNLLPPSSKETGDC